MSKQNNNKKSSYKKKPISNLLKTEVWEKNCGKKYESNCFVCNKMINVNSWECGHVKAEAKGGKLNVNNLKPICSECNKSMGTMNMIEFKNKYFPRESSCIIF